MSYYWLILTVSWLGSVRLQYINSSPRANVIAFDSLADYPPIPYGFKQGQDENVDTFNRFSLKDLFEANRIQRNRRTIITNEDLQNRKWQPNLVDTDKTIYYNGEDRNVNPFLQGYLGNNDDNITMDNPEPIVQKRSFSPWGGKRSDPFIQQTWSWKRASNIKETTMPKRVRFSPWGGKRSGQIVYRPSTKASRIIFSSSVPEMTKIISNYPPTGERIKVAGYQMVPLDKRHPVRILSLSNIEGRPMREGLPFKDYMEPNFFKPGHTYTDVDMKKDGKRKVKFNAWGGKRSPPIIGPIWTPGQNEKEPTMQDLMKENVDFKNTAEYEDPIRNQQE